MSSSSPQPRRQAAGCQEHAQGQAPQTGLMEHMLMMSLDATRPLAELARFCVLSSPPSTEVRFFCEAFQTRPSGIVRRCAAGLEVATIPSYGNGVAR